MFSVSKPRIACFAFIVGIFPFSSMFLWSHCWTVAILSDKWIFSWSRSDAFNLSVVAGALFIIIEPLLIMTMSALAPLVVAVVASRAALLVRSVLIT